MLARQLQISASSRRRSSLFASHDTSLIAMAAVRPPKVGHGLRMSAVSHTKRPQPRPTSAASRASRCAEHSRCRGHIVPGWHSGQRSTYRATLGSRSIACVAAGARRSPVAAVVPAERALYLGTLTVATRHTTKHTRSSGSGAAFL